MTYLTPNHPAVDAALLVVYGQRDETCAPEMADALNAALPHLTADDLRDTPAGRALMAEAWDQGAEAGERDYATALDPGHECIPNPYREDNA